MQRELTAILAQSFRARIPFLTLSPGSFKPTRMEVWSQASCSQRVRCRVFILFLPLHPCVAKMCQMLLSFGANDMLTHFPLTNGSQKRNSSPDGASVLHTDVSRQRPVVSSLTRCVLCRHASCCLQHKHGLSPLVSVCFQWPKSSVSFCCNIP